MAFIVTITLLLLIGGLPTALIVFFSRKTMIHRFHELAKKTGLNFALPKRKNILENPKPALVGDYKNRLVNMTTRIKDNIPFTEIAMNCNTHWTANIEAKGQFAENYIYNTLYNSEYKAILTGDDVFDRYFFVKVRKEEEINLFTSNIRSFLINQRNNINFIIEICEYEIVVHDKNLSSSERTEGGIAANTVFMLNFMSELADLLERKQLK